VIEPSDEQPQALSKEQLSALCATERWVRSAQRQESAYRMHGCDMQRLFPLPGSCLGSDSGGTCRSCSGRIVPFGPMTGAVARGPR
jgi:hypothetical protein